MGVQELCLIGTITGAVGIAGGVRVLSHSDNPGRFALLKTVHLRDSDGRDRVLHVRKAEEKGSRIVLFFEGVLTRTDAETLRGLDILIEDVDMLPPPEGRHYIHDLIGCTVIDDDGNTVGVVRDVTLLPANDVYVVDTPRGELLLPAIPDFIHRVDTASKTIVAVPDENLYEVGDAD